MSNPLWPVPRMCFSIWFHIPYRGRNRLREVKLPVQGLTAVETAPQLLPKSTLIPLDQLIKPSVGCEAAQLQKGGEGGSPAACWDPSQCGP